MMFSFCPQHVDGHSEPAERGTRASGSPLQNPAQRRSNRPATTVSFRRDQFIIDFTKKIQELTIKESINSQRSLYFTHVQSNAIQYNTSGINPTSFEDYVIQFSQKYVSLIICLSLMS